MSTNGNTHPHRGPLARFTRDQRGSISVLTVVTMLPFLVAAGTAIDMGRANRTIGLMQKAVDTAALAAAATQHPIEVADGDPLTGDAAKIHVAEQMIEANLLAQVKATAEDPQVAVTGDIVKVDLAAEMPTSFMKLVGIDTMSLAVTATAEAEINATGCVVALGPEGKGIKVGGTVELEVKGCWLYSNKKADSSIDIIGTATVDVPGSCSVGTTTVSDNATVHDKRLSGCHEIVDPLAGWTHPDIPETCDYNKFKKSATSVKSITLSPGRYCGGLQLSGFDTVDLAPGIYHIDGGALTINSKVDLSGEGVAFYLANDVTAVTINGTANVSLTAPDSGAMAGMLFAMEPGADDLISAKINGGSDLVLEGTLYLKSGDLEISGNSATLSSAMRIVADSVTLSGTSKLSFTAQPDEFGNPLGEQFLTMVRLIK